MLRSLIFCLAGVLGIAGCSPTFNWREVRLDGGVKALLPCKPDRGQRPMLLAGQTIDLQMTGCESGGALFAVAHAELADAAALVPAQAQWEAAMLANMQAGAPQILPYPIKGAATEPAPQRLQAQGRRADGRLVAAQGIWFARGKHLYHAVIYADKLEAEATEPFFAGLELL